MGNNKILSRIGYLFLLVAYVFVFFLITFLPNHKVSALTAANQAELNSLAGSLAFTDPNTITGKIGTQTITFKKIPPQGLPVRNIYEAVNLDCGGEKARVERFANPIAGVEDAVRLYAKFQQGTTCTDVRINATITTQAFADNVANSTVDGVEPADNCEASDSGPLGWILCPIIGIASNFTNFVFVEFVKPFLEDVPVTTDTSDGSYIAWSQFRLIGNIVLVGTMLAVVYAQIKGN